MDTAAFHFTDALVNLTCGLTCLSLWLNQRKDTCLAYWGIGLLVYGTMNSLFPFAPNTPLANSAGFSILKVADILFWAGFRVFDGRRAVNRWLLIAPIAPFGTCLLVGSMSGNWTLAETGTLLVYAAIAFAQVVYVFRGRTSLFGPRSISAAVVMLNVIVLLTVSLFRDSWFTAETGQAAFLLTDHMVTIVFTMCVIAMVGERDFRMVLRSAHRDPLTGLLNRSGLADAIAKRADARTLLLCDLDHFKQINDGYGHDGGDEVLRAFADRMAQATGPNDLVVRLGGEEFLIATADTSLQRAIRLAEGVLSATRAKPAQIGLSAIPFTVSIGVAIRRADEDLDHAIKRADQALYSAKTEGRDRASIADTNTGGCDPKRFDAPCRFPQPGAGVAR